MSDDETLDTLHDSVSNDAPTPETPLRPTKEYEDITIRQITVGFPGQPPQDFTLYPEDKIDYREDGYIGIEFVTLGGGMFEAFPQHVAWRSYRELPHKREKGTLRPSPKQLMKDMAAGTL